VFRRRPWVGYGELTVADDRAARGHIDGDALGAAEGAEIDHPARAGPRDGVELPVVNGATVANDLAVVVHCVGVSGPAESTQIDHSGLLSPHESMMNGDRRCVV